MDSRRCDRGVNGWVGRWVGSYPCALWLSLVLIQIRNPLEALIGPVGQYFHAPGARGYTPPHPHTQHLARVLDWVGASVVVFVEQAVRYCFLRTGTLPNRSLSGDRFSVTAHSFAGPTTQPPIRTITLCVCAPGCACEDAVTRMCTYMRCVMNPAILLRIRFDGTMATWCRKRICC